MRDGTKKSKIKDSKWACQVERWRVCCGSAKIEQRPNSEQGNRPWLIEELLRVKLLWEATIGQKVPADTLSLQTAHPADRPSPRDRFRTQRELGTWVAEIFQLSLSHGSVLWKGWMGSVPLLLRSEKCHLLVNRLSHGLGVEAVITAGCFFWISQSLVLMCDYKHTTIMERSTLTRYFKAFDQDLLVAHSVGHLGETNNELNCMCADFLIKSHGIQWQDAV